MQLRITSMPGARRALMAASVVTLALAGLSVVAGVSPGPISTIAGSKTFCGDGGPRLDACLNLPTNLARDAAGNIYVADNANHRVRKIAADGTVTTYAGNGSGALCGDSGPATSACLDFPLGLALDSAGNLYIADSNNDRVRKVAAGTQVITTVAGGGVCTAPNIGDGALATNACLNSPRGLAVDGSGNLYIADARHHRVRRVDAATQVITTVAGTGTAGTCGDGGVATAACLNRPRGLAMTAGGDLYIADESNRRIRRLSGGLLTTVAGGGVCVAPSVGDGGPATSACLNSPRGVAVDGTGQIYIADSGNDRVRRVALDGVITTIAGNGTDTYCGDGGPATSACISSPDDVLLDGAGGYLVAGAFERRIRAVSAGGTISTYAGIGSYCGDTGPAVDACLGSPQAVVVGPDGYTYIADTHNHRVRRVSPTGTITAFAGTGVPGFCGDGGAAASACLFFPRGLAFDSGGNLYIADSSNNRIRKVTPAGTISTYAGSGTPGFCGDGGAAASACLYLPRAVAVSPATGEIHIGDTTNERIRKVDGAGTITTIAGDGTAGFCGDGGPAASACIDSPRAMTFDASANLYFADSVNDRVRKIDTAGMITTVAGNGLSKFTGDGGAATLASIDRPEGVAVDSGGNLYISDHFSGRVRVVSGGIITTFAGKATGGFCGDGGIATNACLSLPRGLAMSGGDLLIADSGNARVRRVAPAVDSDGDGCLDVQELGTDHVLGGQRDPLYFWDFYDVNGTKSVGLADTLLILSHFGHAPTGDALDNLLDRYIPDVTQGWRTAEANNGVGLADALANLRSFGDSCAGPP